MTVALRSLLPREGPRPARFTVDEFLKLDATGIFEKHGRTELIQGEIYIMSAQHRRHARIKAQLARELESALAGSEWAILTEVTVNMAPDDAPEPDIVLTNDPDGDGPVPLGSVGLIVEISDATLAFDLGSKAKLYARHGVSEYWVVDVEGKVIHQQWGPNAVGYAHLQKHMFGDSFTSQTISGLMVATGRLGISRAG